MKQNTAKNGHFRPKRQFLAILSHILSCDDFETFTFVSLFFIRKLLSYTTKVYHLIKGK